MKYVIVFFEGRLLEREIPSFRGAIMGIAGNDPLFHNHTEDAADINRYPRIQYKLIDGRPAIVGINDGAEALTKLFLPGAKHIVMIGRDYRSLVVSEVKEEHFNFPLNGGESTRYRINKWLPFNSENYSEYQQISSLSDKVSKLDEILTGNILSLYKSFEAFVQDHISAHIVELTPRKATFKGIHMLAFDAVIETNFALPVHCGIGKGVSHGFGVIIRR